VVVNDAPHPFEKKVEPAATEEAKPFTSPFPKKDDGVPVVAINSEPGASPFDPVTTAAAKVADPYAQPV